MAGVAWLGKPRRKAESIALAPVLKRRLGLIETVAVAVGAMIGSGIYVSMGEAAKTASALRPPSHHRRRNGCHAQRFEFRRARRG